MSEKKREILFRGKENPSGEWIEGFLVGNCHIGDWVTATPVHSKTVGQFTGLTDKNGKKIFEGDIFRDIDGAMDGIPRVVRWNEWHMEFQCPLVKRHWAYGTNSCSLYLMRYRNIEVIGNIHDNPELLKEEPNV